MNYLIVALGGAVGSVVRFALAGVFARMISFNLFPIAIVIVNITGSFLLAVITGALAKYAQGSQHFQLLLAVGFCGGYTTFSTFSLESWQMISAGKFTAAVAYVLSSVVLSILAFGTGLWVMR